ncbi:hypothetical protein I5907_00630 [Panacibacter sp. DH6]|uniref:Lipoprotein n=1 Tax=Panacibacter microcysteis TaxID=2793269 RepID=A0A931E5D9_9BACT|nr:hypothetical protein [Panacibacter microcysteis]MBG9374724.1 hypothetical protein [Panacibacter microcysteis]
MQLTKAKNIKGIIVLTLTVTVIFIGCSKEIGSKKEADTALTASQSVASELVSDTAVVKFFRSTFSSRGSRTDFRNEVSDTTAIISLDYVIEKKFIPAGRNKVLLNYADGGLTNKGWKYELTIDPKTGNLTLAPNDVMAAQIVPGSFKVLTVTFDRYTSTFNFFTEAKEASNNIVHQVFEIVTRQ